MTNGFDNIQSPQLTTDGSAYPSHARQLAKKWDHRLESRGVRGLGGAWLRGVHEGFVRARVNQLRPDLRFVFMLSSMRSGTSMLTQVLCSHKEIDGFGETHIKYDSDTSFVELIRRIMWARHAWRFRRRRYFDKVLHAELIEDITLLSMMPIDWVILHRPGKACVQSMVRTLSMSPEKASAYFIRQWSVIDEWVACLEENPKNRIVTIGYDEIVSDPEAALERFSSGLGLEPSLKAEYEVRRGANRPGANDPSGHLEHGRVKKVQHESEVDIDPTILQRLERADTRIRALVERLEARS